MPIRLGLRYNRSIIRAFSDKVTGSTNTNPSAKSSPSILSAAGLSEKCVKPKSPGQLGAPTWASAVGNYKVPEYFCYDKMSFAEAEIEMAKYRCPQPSAL